MHIHVILRPLEPNLLRSLLALLIFFPSSSFRSLLWSIHPPWKRVKWYCAIINVLSAVELHGDSLAVEVCDGGEKVGLRIALLCLLSCYPDICPN